MSTVSFRYIADDVDVAVDFYAQRRLQTRNAGRAWLCGALARGPAAAAQSARRGRCRTADAGCPPYAPRGPEILLEDPSAARSSSSSPPAPERTGL